MVIGFVRSDWFILGLIVWEMKSNSEFVDFAKMEGGGDLYRINEEMVEATSQYIIVIRARKHRITSRKEGALNRSYFWIQKGKVGRQSYFLIAWRFHLSFIHDDENVCI